MALMHAKQNRPARTPRVPLAQGLEAFQPQPCVVVRGRQVPRPEKIEHGAQKIPIRSPREGAALRRRVAVAEDTFEIGQRHAAPARIQQVGERAQPVGQPHAAPAREPRQPAQEQAAAQLFEAIAKFFPAGHGGKDEG